MVPELRPFQLRAIDQTYAAARNGARVIVLQSPAGSGKSTIGAGLVRRALDKGKSVCFFVQRRRLVTQFSDRLLDFEIDHGIFMRGHPREKTCRVQVCSRDTFLSRVVRNEYVAPPPADLVIVDEGRHAASPEFRALLKPYEDRGSYIILLDATPVLADGRGLGPWAKAIVIAAQPSELIQGGYLVPLKIFRPGMKMKNGKVVRGIAGNLVESWKEYSQGLPTILYCSRVQHSKDAVAAFEAEGIPAVHVDADTPDAERDRIFEEDLLNGKVKVVGNVGIAKEGVDVPCVGCVQFYMEPPGRVGWLQGCGRAMRPFPGKTHGVVIDHGGAVFRHGFPDEDTEWTLEGNVDADFKEKHDKGLTAAALYCAHCELIYHGTEGCPKCGRRPVKPPRSIFKAPPLHSSQEILTEAERGGDTSWYAREQKIKTWFACLATARKRNGTFGMAGMIYKNKYGEFPGEDFPCMPGRGKENWQRKVAEVYPNFGRKKAQ